MTDLLVLTTLLPASAGPLQDASEQAAHRVFCGSVTGSHLQHHLGHVWLFSKLEGCVAASASGHCSHLGPRPTGCPGGPVQLNKGRVLEY